MRVMRRTLGRRPRGIVATALAMFALAGTLAFGPHFARAADVTEVADLGLSYRDTVVPDNRTRRIIAIQGGDAASPLELEVFDGDSLKHLDHRAFPQWWNQGARRGQPTVYEFDEGARSLYLVAHHTQAERLVAVNPLLVIVDVDTFEVREVPLAAAVPPGFVTQGIKLEGNTLYLLQQVVAVPPQATRLPPVLVVEADASTGLPLSVLPVRGCMEVVSNFSQSTFVQDRDEILVSCATTSVQGLVATPGAPAIIAVPIANPIDITSYSLPGGYSQGDVYYDPGARRLLVVGSTPGEPNQSLWVFDLRRRLFLGQVAAGDRGLFSAGVNPASGRLYVGSSISLLVSSARGLQIPQAFELPGFSNNIGTITTLPWNRYVIVPKHPGRLVVYRDDLPDDAIVPGAPVDYRSFDRIATDTPQFAADVQAFGWRARQIGGVTGARQNVLPSALEGTWQLVQDPVSDMTGLRDATNVVTFARVTAAHLSEADAGAKAASVDADDTTDSNADVLLGDPLSTDEASCVDLGGGVMEREDEGVRVECRKEEGVVIASVVYPGLSLPGLPVRVGRASASTTLKRDPKKGLIATAHAEARDVEIGSDVEIGYVASDVSVGAFGKPKTAHAMYTPTFRNVRAGSFECAEECPMWDVLRSISSALSAQFVVEFPSADLERTPGGTHAHAFREAWEHQQDVVLNGEGDQEIQVPALRIIVVNDGSAASRTVLDFAATKADATWFRFSPSPEVPAFGQLPPEIIPPVPAVDVLVPGLPAASDTGTGGAVTRVVKVLGRGWKFLLTGGPGAVLRSAVLWILFVTPFFLAARRRHLLRLAAGGRR